MLTMSHHNHTFVVGNLSVLGKRLYKKRHVGILYWDMVMSYLLVLKS
jgi:hypothetical protein